MPKTDLPAGERHLAQADPVLRRLIASHGPCTLGGKRRDPFHVLCSSIISQQLSIKAADTIQARVHTRVGATRHLRPEHFLQSAAEDLRACGLSNAKAQWLRAIADAVHEGRFRFSDLRRMDDEAAIQALDALPGIGRWTAEMFLIFALDRPDIFSMADVGLRNAVNRLYGKGRKLSDARTLKISGAWAPYRSIASWYLWRTVDGPDAT